MYVPNEDLKMLLDKTNKALERHKLIQENILSVSSVLRVVHLLNS